MDNEPPREAGTFKLRWRPEKGDLMPGVDLENRSALYAFMDEGNDRLLYQGALRAAMRTVKTLVRPQGNVKLEVFTRPDGTFGFEEWKWLEEENSWCPLGQHPISITDTLERALEEARGRIPWVEQALPLP